MGGVYILNQIFDRESDRINKKLFLLSQGIFPLWLAILELVICWALALLLIRGMSTPFINLFIGAWVLGILYTTPPFKLKKRPLLDLIANGAGYGIITFLLGATAARPYGAEIVWWALPYALAVGGVFVNTTIVDMNGDRKANEQTTAILLGARTSRFLSLLLITTAIVLAIINRDNLALVAIALSLPVFILAIIKGERRFDILSFRLPPFILAVAAGLVYPPYLIFLALVILAMRIYYQKRFNLTFPSPLGG